MARCIVVSADPTAAPPDAGLLIVAAGTRRPAGSRGSRRHRRVDGLPRRPAQRRGRRRAASPAGPAGTLQQARVIVVVAGMEAALASVVSGLVSARSSPCPPASATARVSRASPALLGMVNSCAPGIGVVNIDNGFGARLPGRADLLDAGCRGCDESKGGNGLNRRNWLLLILLTVAAFAGPAGVRRPARGKRACWRTRRRPTRGWRLLSAWPW